MNIFKYIINFFKKLNANDDNELFSTEEFNKPQYLNYKKCPQCGTEGSTNEEIITIFGKRTAYGHPDVQSWCKQCRLNKNATVVETENTESLF